MKVHEAIDALRKCPDRRRLWRLDPFMTDIFSRPVLDIGNLRDVLDPQAKEGESMRDTARRLYGARAAAALEFLACPVREE